MYSVATQEIDEPALTTNVTSWSSDAGSKREAWQVSHGPVTWRKYAFTLSLTSTHNYTLAPAPREKLVEFNWVSRALELGASAFDVRNISEILIEMDQNLYAGRFDLVGAAARALPFSELSPHVLIAVIRALSPARDRIGDWTRLVEMVRTELESRGIDARRMLGGIL